MKRAEESEPRSLYNKPLQVERGVASYVSGPPTSSAFTGQRPVPTQSRTRLTRINSNSMSAPVTVGVPTIAIVGRPNVGKSTLFNRIVGSRRAIVGDEPGITRDRLYGDSEWRGREFRVIDTGGILPEDKDFIPSEIYRQARVALDEAAAIIMVIDGRTELAGPDLELVRLLR